MQPQQVTILSLDYMLLGRITPQRTQVNKIGSISNRGRDSCEWVSELALGSNGKDLHFLLSSALF